MTIRLAIFFLALALGFSAHSAPRPRKSVTCENLLGNRTWSWATFESLLLDFRKSRSELISVVISVNVSAIESKWGNMIADAIVNLSASHAIGSKNVDENPSDELIFYEVRGKRDDVRATIANFESALHAVNRLTNQILPHGYAIR